MIKLDKLPEDELAERAVLGGLIVEPSLTAKAISRGLEEKDFFYQEHRKLFSILKDLYTERGENWDDIVFFQYCEKKGVEVNRNLFYALAEEAATGELFEYALARVLELAALRESIELALGIIKAKDLEEVQKKISQLEEVVRGKTTSHSIHISELVSELYEELQHRREEKKVIVGVESGFLSLDLKTGGMQKRWLVVIGARPGMGKSSLMLSMALHMGMQNRKVLIHSLEMSSLELTERMLAMLSGIPLKNIRTGQLTEEDMEKLLSASLMLRKMPIFIDDRASITPLDIRVQAKLISAEVVFVDYLQLVNAEKDFRNRQEAVAEVSKALKALAKDLNLCLIALAQLNRQVETRASKRPTLADLRESGQIEQDADLILFLHRPEYYKNNPAPEEKDRAELIIAKNRHGPVGTIFLRFDKETTAFKELSGQIEQQRDQEEGGDFDYEEIEF